MAKKNDRIKHGDLRGLTEISINKLQKQSQESKTSSEIPVKEHIKTIVMGAKLTPHHCQNKNSALKSPDGDMDTCPNPCGACMFVENPDKITGIRREFEIVLDVEKYNQNQAFVN